MSGVPAFAAAAAAPLLAVWLLPLIGAVALWALGPALKRTAGVLGSLTVLAAFGIAAALFPAATQNGGVHVPLVTWIPGYAFGLWLDPLSLIWTLIITGVGGLIHVYSIGYMWNDRAIARFFAYLNFFVFSMLTLVLSDNVVGLLVGWGLVGLASYFLIGFWFQRPSAVAAARKAFVINVFGDIGIMFAVFAIYQQTGSIAFADVFAKAPSLAPGIVFAICLGLFIGAAAKSAQVPLHTWLPDAMEGPTPVSALIHAATMVTAGVYLVARFAPLWNASPSAQTLVAVVGAITALTGALLGIAQWDIKRILAYSTMSQIGYMILGVGVGAYQAGVLHFFTHAFFKAQLFLGAGLIIHALHDEQDVRKMGGLSRRLPFAFWAMLLGTLAIMGFPGFSGYFSKDAVIEGALLHGHPVLAAVAALTAGITAYYMFRMIFLTFFGPYRGDVDEFSLGMPLRVHAAAHEPDQEHGGHAPDWIMQLPVAILMVPTVLAGWLSFGTESPWSRFFGGLFGAGEPAAPFPEWITTSGVLLLVALGLVVAYLRYGSPGAQAAAIDRLRAESRGMPQILVRGFYFDDLIEFAVVKPAAWLGEIFSRYVDPHVIDGAVRDVVWLAGALGYVMRALQNGLVRAYALTIVVGTACFLAYFAFIGAVK
ncbi:MAG: NADH-quinone oxidoreductase subunit L [Candidatus Baltobacteraceae bacterium]|jgi:NADH-quinone oxidoreductase subunit L